LTKTERSRVLDSSPPQPQVRRQAAINIEGLVDAHDIII